MNNPKVSVIIPVYNSERFIAQAIESALTQTYKNLEVIVVNDGSTDNSYEKIKPYLSSIKYISQENKGVSAARNTGIKNSEGELIAFLDSDDIWLSEKLDLQRDYLRSNPDVGLVHSNILYINKNGNLIPSNTDFATDASGMCFKELFKHGNKILTSSVVLRKNCFKKAGYFAENIHYAEDYELWLKVAKHFAIGHINQPLVLYRIHTTNTTQNHQGREEYYRLKIISNVLSEFPDSRKILGKEIVNDRLFELTYTVAKRYFRQKNRLKSLWFFFKTMKINPVKFFSELLLGVLSSSQRKALNWYKYRIVKILRQ